MERIISIAGVAVLIVAVLVAFVWFTQRSLLFPRPFVPPTDLAAAMPGLQKLSLGGDDAVEAWYLPPLQGPPLEVGADHPALIFAHGNGELIDYWVSEFEEPRRWGMGVLLVEYPGYGRSGGSPSQVSITRTFTQAYDELAALPEVDPDRIIGYGRSLGGGAICQLAKRRPLAALVLESTFTGVAPLARGMGVPRWLVRDRFDNLEVLSDFAGPVLLLHGSRDRIIPFSHAEALAQASSTAELHEMPCGHNDCPRPWAPIGTFLARAGIVSGSPNPAIQE